VNPEVYKKLPGAYRTLMKKWTLWMAGDHLLLVQSSRVAEQYKRFYFRDIQAIVIGKRDGVSDRVVARVVILTILLLVVAVNIQGRPGRDLSLLLLSCYVVWWMRRPNCVCFIQTATQTEQILPLSQFRTASKVVGEIRSKIEAAQSESLAGAESSEQPQPPPLV
jgi:hypothetical protein